MLIIPGAKQEFMEVVALAPSGNSKPCQVNKVQGGFAATFKPDESGEWKVQVQYKGKDIQGKLLLNTNYEEIIHFL